MPEKITGRLAGDASDAAAGAEATSVVMARECRARRLPDGPPRLPRRVRYHSADVATEPAQSMTRAPLRVGLLGAGTVGREVVHALFDRPAEISPSDGRA